MQFLLDSATSAHPLRIASLITTMNVRTYYMYCCIHTLVDPNLNGTHVQLEYPCSAEESPHTKSTVLIVAFTQAEKMPIRISHLLSSLTSMFYLAIVTLWFNVVFDTYECPS